MFLALGVGAYQPAIFHLMTHAFFKALLFLSSGSVILAMHHEQDIFKMGGLRKHIPIVFWCMLIGTMALTALPFTSGYFSKDEILHEAYLTGHTDLWLAGLLGAFLTALYSFRLIFITFFGAERWRATAHKHDAAHDEHAHHGLAANENPHGAKTLDHHIPLMVLLAFAIFGGFIHLPLEGVLPLIVTLAGIGLSWFLFLKNPAIPERLKNGAVTKYIGQFWKSAFAFDWLYDKLFVRPYLWLVHINRNDVVDVFITKIPDAFHSAHSFLAATQNGRMRNYAFAMGVGACLVIVVVVL
jgi:NADH-quinone oxidoreductase subunit L